MEYRYRSAPIGLTYLNHRRHQRVVNFASIGRVNKNPRNGFLSRDELFFDELSFNEGLSYLKLLQMGSNLRNIG